MPMIAALLGGAGISDARAARFGARLVIPVGMAVSAGGLAMFVMISPDSGYGAVAPALLVFGFGLGLGLPLAADTVLDALTSGQAGMGNALSRTLQSVGISLGSAILGSVVDSTYRSSVGPALTGLPGEARTTARSGVAGAHAVASHLPPPVARPLTRAADHAYLHGMSQAAITTAVLLVVGAALVLLLLPKEHGELLAEPERRPEPRARASQ
ncbi:hypothetical protein [Kitasatospora sp. NBC_01302]|uniref:hypothetical protein n=1 Tax=Kitasatospora sp. NBC_01302 TaxID=2903575 RepID=UPI002E1634C2|nr:hypothetical protein OG294_10635 [Kitasatospora sp. NBC_01302]